MTLGILLIGLLIPIVSSSYVESISANVDGVKSNKFEKFVPLVAFNCGYRNQYMSENGGWKTDESRYATCLSGKLDILKYCRKAYPTMNITNIVEYSHEVSIGKWCREEGSPCKWTHTVRPFQCIDGEFRSKALQVPHDCKFSHTQSRDQCNDYAHWRDEAAKQCSAKKTDKKKSMAVRSFAVLEPCSIDMFNGVEFVCCPAEQIAKEDLIKATGEDIDDDEEDTYEEDYTEEADEEADDAEQDPYFKAANWTNEHENFKDAEDRIETRHRKKIDKVMKEWGDLEARYSQMKKKDPKGAEQFKTQMTNRFQKTVASLEEEHKKMKKEVEAVHEERVQAILNEKKRDATHDYRQALATHVNNPNKHNVLQKLKVYIRAEEKDRMHTLNRYRHLLRTDQQDANNFRHTVLHRLRYIDLRINGTLAMLRDFPDLEKYVRPIALVYWQDIRRENTPELDDEAINSLNTLEDDAKNKKLVDLYTEQYEKQHSSAKLDVKAPATTTTEQSKKEAKVLPTENSASSEDEDDEYYEDEEDEEIKKKTPNDRIQIIKINPKSEDKSEKLPVVKTRIQPPKLVETSVKADEESADDDTSSTSDSEEDGDDDDGKNIKELRVDIEPIIEERPSFYRQERLIQIENARTESLMSSSQIVLVVIAAAFAGSVFMLLTAVRKRRAMRGFMEVDVYTPEERHVAGMQVNGYENPTYSFFDSKA